MCRIYIKAREDGDTETGIESDCEKEADGECEVREYIVDGVKCIVTRHFSNVGDFKEMSENFVYTRAVGDRRE